MKALRLFFTLLYRRTPAALLVLLVVQVLVVLFLPTGPLSWLALWFQLGFCVNQGAGDRYYGRKSVVLVAWWVFREALCWPLSFYRCYKGQGA